MTQWKVSVIWPEADRVVESAAAHDAVEITDGGVLRMLRDGKVAAVYGPGFWVAAFPIAEEGQP